MTITSLLLGTIFSQILFVLTKILFIDYLNFDSNIIFWLFFVFIVLETIAVVRRMGILNLFEAFFLSIVWVITSLLVDLVITTNIIGRDVYSHLYFWFVYLTIFLAIMIFHKKAHVEARKKA